VLQVVPSLALAVPLGGSELVWQSAWQLRSSLPETFLLPRRSRKLLETPQEAAAVQDEQEHQGALLLVDLECPLKILTARDWPWDLLDPARLEQVQLERLLSAQGSWRRRWM